MGKLVKLRGLRVFVGCMGRLGTHSSDPRGEVNFNYLSWREESEK